LRILEKISTDPSSLSQIIEEANQLRAILSKSVATAKGTAEPSGNQSAAVDSLNTFSSRI
jgi:hypothetical protein